MPCSLGHFPGRLAIPGCPRHSRGDRITGQGWPGRVSAARGTAAKGRSQSWTRGARLCKRGAPVPPAGHLLAEREVIQAGAPGGRRRRTGGPVWTSVDHGATGSGDPGSISAGQQASPGVRTQRQGHRPWLRGLQLFLPRLELAAPSQDPQRFNSHAPPGAALSATLKCTRTFGTSRSPHRTLLPKERERGAARRGQSRAPLSKRRPPSRVCPQTWPYGPPPSPWACPAGARLPPPAAAG